MGGRGTYAAGNDVPFRYKTVGVIEGVKVLEPIDDKASRRLPEEAHSSMAYIKLDTTGKFSQYREYNDFSLSSSTTCRPDMTPRQ